MNDRDIEREADDVLAAHEVRGLPVDPMIIAAAEGIRIASGKFDDCFDGRIEYYRKGDRGTFYLFYTEERSPDRPIGRVRFSIGHELGHYFLPHHRRELTAGHWHASHADFSSDHPVEREADRFAAALLMPRRAFGERVAKFPRAVCTLSDLGRLAATAFVTSLTSTIHRYVELDFEPCALVVSAEGLVRYAFLSASMKTLGLGWVQPGSPVPPTSATGRTTSPSEPLRRQGGASIDSDVWFDRPVCRTMWEDVVVLGDGRTLTLLTIDDDSDDE